MLRLLKLILSIVKEYITIIVNVLYEFLVFIIAVINFCRKYLYLLQFRFNFEKFLNF